MNWLTEILRDSDAKNQLVDDLEAFAVLCVFAVCVMAFLWLD